MLEQTSSVLRITALVHAALALAWALWFMADATPIESHHPAWKPFKFALSIGLFLLTMAWITPSLQVPSGIRQSIDWLLASTMLVEMLAIGLQALRGRTSHFNEGTLLDSLVWKSMMVAIVITSLTMLAVALIATLGQLVHHDASVLPPLRTLAIRSGLWLFLFVPISGFTMGGRMSRFVGGMSEEGLPILHWSTAQGDLRVSHFFALHALQVLLVLALALEHLALREGIARGLMYGAITLSFAVIALTYVQAQRGRPLVSLRGPEAAKERPLPHGTRSPPHEHPSSKADWTAQSQGSFAVASPHAQARPRLDRHLARQPHRM